MPDTGVLAEDSGRESGRMAENILNFARLLRSAGMPVGTGQVIDALKAADLVGFGNRQDFYWCLFSLFVSRNEQRQLFEQAFNIFWRNPHIIERMLGAMLPQISVDTPPDLEAMSRRLQEALHPGSGPNDSKSGDELEFDAALTGSSREILRQKDFEQMSAGEVAAARKLIARMSLDTRKVPTRRFETATGGEKVDLRNSLRSSLRAPQSITLRFRKPRLRRPPLVILCDISGSMARYSRMFLHFMHALSNDRDRVQAFVFATRLTNISRSLRHRDVDVALDRVSAAVLDFDGGTRIGSCLAQFNRQWSRRVLGQGAVTLIVSDGLDRDGAQGLVPQMDRLARSSRRLVWLNPLLRYEGFEPRARGVKAMLPYVDDFRTVHNLQSLEQLAGALAGLP